MTTTRTFDENFAMAFELIAGVPLCYGFTPRNSLVLATFQIAGGAWHVGPISRVDIGMVVQAAAGCERAHSEIVRVLELFGRYRLSGAVVVYYPAPGEDLPQDLRWLTEYLDSLWSLPIQGGYFALGEDLVAFDNYGQPQATFDKLELLATKVAIEAGHTELLSGPEEFRWQVDLAVSRAVGSGRRDCGAPGERALLEGAVALAQSWDRPHTLAAETIELLSCAFKDLVFRDAFINWVRWGEPAGFMEALAALALDGGQRARAVLRTASEVPAGGPAALAEELLKAAAWAPNRASQPVLGRSSKAIAFLRHLAERTTDPGHLVATGAFLAWHQGNGAQARILSDQALDLAGENSLALLVNNVLAANLSPPWMEAMLNRPPAGAV